jgi:hypothetical protein
LFYIGWDEDRVFEPSSRLTLACGVRGGRPGLVPLARDREGGGAVRELVAWLARELRLVPERGAPHQTRGARDERKVHDQTGWGEETHTLI